MEYIIIGLFVLLIYIVYKQCSSTNIIDTFIAAYPSTSYNLSGEIDNNGKAERSFGPPVFLNGEHYNYNCTGSNYEKSNDKCDAKNGGCICGNNCNMDNCVEPRWKWNERWIERAKLEMKREEMKIGKNYNSKKCC